MLGIKSDHVMNFLIGFHTMYVHFPLLFRADFSFIITAHLYIFIPIFIVSPIIAFRLMLFVCSWCDKKKLSHLLCLSHITLPGPVWAVPGLFPSCFEPKTYVHSRGPHGPRARRTNFASPYGARRVLMHALLAYGPRTGLEIVRSPWTARAGTVRGPPNTTPVWDFCPFWVCQFPYVSVRAPYGTLAGHARAPYGARHGRIWKTLKIPVRGPYDARTGIAWGTRGVWRIIQPNSRIQPCQAVRGRSLMWPREQAPT